MALGRKASAEPLSSEDMALLAAVAAQAATALENGRLYGQLRVKADELDRMREFSENILESLNDGLAVVNRDDRVVRWNRRLEELYGLRHEEAVGRPLARDLRRRRSSRCCGARGASRPTARRSTACRSGPRHAPSRRRARQRRDDAAARRGRGDRRDDPDRRGHLGARAARRAAADLREDGLDRPARRRRRARGEHAAHRHLELHADADGAAPSRTIRGPQVLEKIEKQTFRAAQDRQRPAEPRAPGAGRDAARSTSTPSSTTCCRCSSTSCGPGRIQVRKELAAIGAGRARASSTSCSRCSSTCS